MFFELASQILDLLKNGSSIMRESMTWPESDLPLGVPWQHLQTMSRFRDEIRSLDRRAVRLAMIVAASFRRTAVIVDIAEAVTA
jgi:hypothetical protein